MKTSELVVGGTYVDISFPRELYEFKGQIPEGGVFVGEYEFKRVDEGEHWFTDEGIICTEKQVEADISPYVGDL